MSDNDNKVVSFRVVEKSAAPEPTDDQIMFKCIDEFTEFLRDNAKDIKHFVAGVALDSGDTDTNNVAFHIFTSPISMPELAMALKMLDNTFYNQLNRGHY